MANINYDQLAGSDLHDNKVYSATGTPLPSWTQTDARYQSRGSISGLPVASASSSGVVTSTDWGAFNGKQASLGFIPLNRAGDTLSGNLLGPLQDKGGQIYNALAYGAVADAATVNDAAMTMGSAILTSASAAFTTADVGKTIVVFGAWTSGQSLKTTISSRQSLTQVTLALSAQSTISNAKVDWGTNNAPYIQAAGNAAIAAGGGRVFLGAGTFLTGGAISFKASNIAVMGAGPGLTTIKATGGYEVLSFGWANASAVFANLSVENLTIDMNNIASGFTYGLIIGAYRGVYARNVRVVNKAAAAANQLYFGVSSGSSAEYARDAIFENCVFDLNSGGAESVLLAQARNVRFLNCTVSNVTGAYGLLQYGSTRCSYLGNTFENGAKVSISRRPTQLIGNQFLASTLEITGCENAEVLGNVFDGGASYNLYGITIKAEVQTSGVEVGWDNPAPPFTRLSNNVQISGNHFYRCNSQAIQAGSTTGSEGNPSLCVDTLIITGNTVRQSYWQGIDVKAKRLILKGNTVYNSGQLGGSSVQQNFVIAAERGLIEGNYSYDDQDNPTVTRDLVINNTLSDSVLPTQDLTFRDNDFTIGSIPAYNNSGSLVTTKPGNITLKGENNLNLNPSKSFLQGNMTGPVTFDRKNGRTITATLTGNVTPTLAVAIFDGEELNLEITQDATGGRTCAKPVNSKVPGGALPISTGVNARDTYRFRWDGIAWLLVGYQLNLS